MDACLDVITRSEEFKHVPIIATPQSEQLCTDSDKGGKVCIPNNLLDPKDVKSDCDTSICKDFHCPSRQHTNYESNVVQVDHADSFKRRICCT